MGVRACASVRGPLHANEPAREYCTDSRQPQKPQGRSSPVSSKRQNALRSLRRELKGPGGSALLKRAPRHGHALLHIIAVIVIIPVAAVKQESFPSSSSCGSDTISFVGPCYLLCYITALLIMLHT